MDKRTVPRTHLLSQHMTGAASETRELTVVGAGGHAKEVISVILASGLSAFAVDDDPLKWGGHVLGVPIAEIDERSEKRAIMAIGDNARRKERVRALKFHWETIVHPTAWVDPSAQLGRGTVVFPNAVIQPDVVIGDHVIVNAGATISHDSVIGDFAHIAPGAHIAGEVRIGEGAFIGIGSSIIPQIQIGAWVTIGAGAAVICDVPENVVAVGVPAKVIL